MSRLRLIPVAVLIALVAYAAALARAPQVQRPQMNLSTLKQQCERYHDSGQYVSDIAAVTAKAEQYLETRKGVPKAALVLDIDETAISNWGLMKQLDFGFEAAAFTQWCEQKRGTAIEPTRKLYAHARRLEFAVFFITGRREKLRAATIGDLEAAGYPHWDELFLAPADYQGNSIVPFKSGVRRTLTRRGFHIVGNVGDQYSDLAGGYADRTFKLPNPLYLIP